MRARTRQVRGTPTSLSTPTPTPTPSPPGAHVVDLVAPLLQRRLHLLHGDGAAAVGVDGLEQLLQAWGEREEGVGGEGEREGEGGLEEGARV